MAPSRRLKQVVAYAAIRLAAGFLGLLPERLAINIGRLVGRGVWMVAGDRKQMAIRHMTRLGGSGTAVARAKQMYDAYGRYWAEALWMRPRRTTEVVERVSTDGLDQVLAARDAGTGMVYALPHIGNWEVAGTIARREGIELVAVAEKLRNRRLIEWFVRLRNMLGIDIVLADGSREVFRQLYGVLDRGGAVALLADRDLSGRGIPTEFFGEQTTLPGGAISLGVRRDVPVFPVASFFREGRGHHIVVAAPIEIPSEGSVEERISAGVAAMAIAFEDLIRRAPEQWHLLQPNWPSDRELA